MKFNKKAGVPIGTIAVIIIVLVAGIGMYWWFTQAGEDCSDVRHYCNAYSIEGDCLHHTYAIRHSESEEYVAIQWWETLSGDQWRFKAYIQANGYITTFIWFYDLDEMNEWWQGKGMISDQQKVDAARMIDCMKAGCPNCQEV